MRANGCVAWLGPDVDALAGEDRTGCRMLDGCAAADGLVMGALVCASVVSLATQPCQAQKRESMQERLEREKAVRHQKLMRAKRLELGLSLGSSLGDVYQRSVPISLNANYFFNDNWGVGGYGFFALQSETALGEQIRIRRPLRTNDGSFSSVGLGFGADVLYTPVHGKLSPLGITAVRYDIGFTLGAGFLQVTTDGEAGAKIAPALGINSRFFINDSLALSVFYKLYIYSYADHVTLVSGESRVEETWGPQGFGGITLSFLTGKARVSIE